MIAILRVSHRAKIHARESRSQSRWIYSVDRHATHILIEIGRLRSPANRISKEELSEACIVMASAIAIEFASEINSPTGKHVIPIISRKGVVTAESLPFCRAEVVE
jgi:hypothetical protein